MAHKGHPKCDFTSKAACDQAAREAMGRCAGETDKGVSCKNWGLGRVGDRPYCGQHLNSILLEDDKKKRAAAKAARLQVRIDRYIVWMREHPSVHDAPPEGYFD